MATDDDEGGGAPPDTKDKKGDKKKQNILIAVGVVGLIIAYLTLRKSSTASSASSSQQPTSAYNPYDYYANDGGYGGTGGSGYGLENYDLLSQIQQELASDSSAGVSTTAATTTTTSGVTQPSSGTTTAPASPAPSQNPTSYQQINIGGTLYDVLGRLGANEPGGEEFTGYNVEGGAPVFFGNATSGVTQGTGNAMPNNYVYTPAQYQSLINPTYITGGKLPV